MKEAPKEDLRTSNLVEKRALEPVKIDLRVVVSVVNRVDDGVGVGEAETVKVVKVSLVNRRVLDFIRVELLGSLLQRVLERDTEVLTVVLSRSEEKDVTGRAVSDLVRAPVVSVDFVRHGGLLRVRLRFSRF